MWVQTFGNYQKGTKKVRRINIQLKFCLFVDVNSDRMLILFNACSGRLNVDRMGPVWIGRSDVDRMDPVWIGRLDVDRLGARAQRQSCVLPAYLEQILLIIIVLLIFKLIVLLFSLLI